jgi:hypothetical protein
MQLGKSPKTFCCCSCCSFCCCCSSCITPAVPLARACYP